MDMQYQDLHDFRENWVNVVFVHNGDSAIRQSFSTLQVIQQSAIYQFSYLPVIQQSTDDLATYQSMIQWLKYLPVIQQSTGTWASISTSDLKLNSRSKISCRSLPESPPDFNSILS